MFEIFLQQIIVGTTFFRKVLVENFWPRILLGHKSREKILCPAFMIVIGLLCISYWTVKERR